MTPPPAASRLDRISFQDWLLAAIGGLFTLGGLLIMRRDFNTGIATLVFFGLCFAHAVRVILRKRRALKQMALTATVAGGVPLRQSRLRMALLGGAILAVGATQAVFGGHAQALLQGIGWLLVAVGAATLLAVAAGLLANDHIQFDPAGITFAQRGGKARVPWDAVTRLARGEISSNPMVLVAVDAEAVVAEPAAYRPRLLAQMARSRGGMGADFVLMSEAYGIDAPVLLAALERYVTQPSARGELARPPKLPG